MGMKYNHLTIENLPYKPLYFSPGSKCLETDTEYSDLVWLCQNLIAYISVIICQVELKFVKGCYFKVLFQHLKSKL